MKQPLVIGIEGSMRTHPLPNLKNFRMVKWGDPLIKKADVYIQANIKENKHKGLREQYQYIIDSGKPYIVTESAVFRQGMNPDKLYHRWAWWSYFQDEADYCNENSPADRWEQIREDQNITVKKWRNNKNGYVLLVLQRPRDSSLRNMVWRHGKYHNFIYNTIRDIRRYTTRKIVIRMHPLKQEQQLEAIDMCKGFSNIEVSKSGFGILEHGASGGDGLVNDLKGAKICVGFNSNALTDAVLEGVPTLSLDPSSMAYPVSNKYIRNIESPEPFDRTQWLCNLGYTQWREDEIKQGLPWEHLKGKYEQFRSK